MRPDPDERGQAHKNEEAIDDDKQHRWYSNGIWFGWRDLARLTPDCGDKTETTEQDQDGSRRSDQPVGNQFVEQGPRSDPGGQRGKACPHPGGIGALGCQHSSVGGQFCAPIRTVSLLLSTMLELTGALRQLDVRLGCSLFLFDRHNRPTRDMTLALPGNPDKPS